MAIRGKASQPLLRRLPNGDWVYLYELRTVSGCLVAMRLNVTEAIHQRDVMSDIARAQARVANERLHEAIEAMPAGVAIYDEDDRLVMCNRQIRDMAPYNLDGELTGQTYAALMRRSLARGDIAAVTGREDEWLRRRLAGRGKANGPLLRRFKGERWVHFYETRTATGCLVTVRLDVTDLVAKSLALERANGQLAKLSHTDSLTELANRRMLDECLQREWQRSARAQQPLTLLLVDIDHFKRYNDHYGHIQGDHCLHQIGRLLQACASRSGDLVARYGGEEFALLLPGTDASDASQVAQRCIDELERAAIEHANSPVSQCLTISIGVASVVADARLSHLSLVRSADTALYRMKEAGRARFEVVTTLAL
jgi:diguanylate cyclase (GGDEF)-like protein